MSGALTTLDAARDYAARGLHVIPLRERGKLPTIDAWQTSASADPTTIDRWFAGTRANIGVVCGPSQIIVVDIDRHGADGYATIDALEAELGALPPTVSAFTGGGGRHLIYRAPDASLDLIGRLGEGVDLLHGSRQIVVSPSVHPSGKSYEWRAGYAPGEHEIAELPAAWIAFATRKPAPKSQPQSHSHYTPSPGDFDPVLAISHWCPGAPSYESDGRRCWDVECPLESSHSSTSRRDSVASIGPDGKLGFDCKHTSHAELHWRDFRKHHEPDWVPFDERDSYRASLLPDRDKPGSSAPADKPATEKSDAPPPVTKRYHRCPDLVAMIMSRASEPWVSITLGDVEIVRVRPGGIVVVMGPTGAGKTSLVIGMSLEHARNHGPVIAGSKELPADEFGARAIGEQCDASWIDALTGKVDEAEMARVLALPRLIVLDRRDVTLSNLIAAIEDMQREYPDQPIVVVVDYVQILESLEKDARSKVADVIAQIDDIARQYRVVVLAISQMSRASSRAARSGESVGADSTDGGAESAAIERAASVTLCIGSSGPEREDGTCAVDLSIGKGRMTGGDRVIPMSYCGRSGRWRVAGDARPASEVRAEKVNARDTAKQSAAELAIVGAIAKSKAPMTRSDLALSAEQGKVIGLRAVKALLDRGELVEVRRRKPRAQGWQVWTREKASVAMVEVVGAEGESCE